MRIYTGKLTPAILAALGGPTAAIATLNLGPSLELEQLENGLGSALQGLNVGAIQGTLDGMFFCMFLGAHICTHFLLRLACSVEPVSSQTRM